MKRHAIALCTTTLFAALSPALAHYCTPINKPIGAGSGASITLGGPTPPQFNVNKQGKLRGGFITIILPDGTRYDVFAHNTLPHTAMNAGPGDSQCDGKGIDNAYNCVTGGHAP